MSEPITSVVFQNAGVLFLDGGMTSFGQTFQAGDLRPGQALYAQISGQAVPVQVDVRNTHPDGSVKMAVLTMERPELTPWQEAEAALVAGGAVPPAPAVSLPEVIAGHSATLSIAIEDGRPPLVIDIGQAVADGIAAGIASFWQQGPYATQARVEIPVADSSLRILLDATGYADGEFRFTVGLNNDRAMEAAGGRLSYTAKVVLDGQTLFDQGLSHGQYQRVSLDFASSDKHGIQGLGAPQEGWLNIKHDIEYLKQTGAIFQYNTDVVADPGVLRSYYDEISENPQWGEIFWSHHLQTDMGVAGGRPDIGYTTAPNAHWILSQDAGAAAYALGQAKVAGYVPWNFYDLSNGAVLNTDNYPKLWTDPRGGGGRPGDPNSTGLTQQVGVTGWGPDRAHQPDLSFIPYLFTGERWMYDNVLSQASHSIMLTWPEPRQEGAGNVIQESQLRSAAWSLRQMEHAAWVAEDGSIEQDYFARMVKANWDWVLSKAPEWSGTWGEIAGFIPSGVYANEVPVWQNAMFAGVVALSAARGSEEARAVLDFMSNFLLGSVLSGDEGFDPHNAVIWRMPTAVNGVPLTSWDALADALRGMGMYAEGGFAYTELEYHRMLVGGLSMAYYATGDQRYREAVETFLKLAPPGAGMENYAHLPQFAVTIPELQQRYRGDPDLPAPTFNPASIVLGTGPDTIVLSISQDYFGGAAQYRVFVDGAQVGGTLTASALKSLAQSDTVTIRGDFGDTVALRVEMVNDLSGGTTARDRNLYVNAISHNGSDLPINAHLAGNAPQDFVFKADGTLLSPAPLARPEPNAAPPPPAIDPLPPKTIELGTGPDAVVIALNQDWYLESAKYVVLLDGKQLGGVQEASAFRSAMETDTLIVRGAFSDRPGNIAIRFVNDKIDGYGRDRNLYIHSATYEGKAIDILPKTSLLSQNETALIVVDHPDLTPKTVVLGAGPDAVTYKINQNYWKGKAEYVVLVNGQQLGETQTVNATITDGTYDMVVVRGTFPAGTTIGLRFLNDTHEGLNKGRDIFVHEVTAGGAALAIDRTVLGATGHTATVQAGVLAPPTAPQDPGVPSVPANAPLAEIAPKTTTLGVGPDEVVVRLNQDWFDGGAQYVVLVDGQQLGGVQTAGALRAKGETDTLVINGDFAGGETVTVRFVNDAYYGAKVWDRNLFVQSVTFNGEAVTPDRKNLLFTGDAAHVVLSGAGVDPPPPPEPPPPEPPPPEPPPPPPVPDQAFAPKVVTVGAGPDEVVLQVNQNYWKGKAEYVVLVDGQQLGERQSVNALLGNGQYDTVIVRGDFSDGTQVGLRFLNDSHEGLNKGRDIFVHAATVNDVPTVVERRDLLATNDTATVKVGAPPPAEPPAFPKLPTVPQTAPVSEIKARTVEIGTGSDEIVIKLNQDWFDGAAQYVVLVDGQQLGGVQTAGALRAKGETDTLVINGDFVGGETVTVRFVNDAYYGVWVWDRNLFVQSVTFNGEAVTPDRKNLLFTGNAATAVLPPGSDLQAENDFGGSVMANSVAPDDRALFEAMSYDSVQAAGAGEVAPAMYLLFPEEKERIGGYDSPA